METARVFKAAKRNDLERVKFFIEKKGVRVNIVNKKQKTIAHVAVRNDNVDMLGFVLAKDPSLLEKEDNHNSTALQLAVKRGAVDIVEYLVENHVHDNKTTANVVQAAIEYGHQDILRYFFEKRKVDVNQPIADHVDPPLWLAMRCQNTNIVKYLIHVAKAKITVLNSDGENILFPAVEQGHLTSIKDLLKQSKRSFDINWKRLDGKTLIHMSVIKKQMEILKYLVEEKKADVNIADNDGNIPLHYANMLSIGEDVAGDYFRYLVMHDADVGKQNKGGQTPLHQWSYDNYRSLAFEVVYNDDLNFLKLLFHNNDLNFEMNWEKWHLQAMAESALQSMKMKVLQYLVKEKNVIISPTMLNNKLREVAKEGNFNEWKSLIELVADVKQVDKNDGNTILHDSLQYSLDTSWYKFLIAQGFDVNQKNKKGETPLHVAVKVTTREICEYLVTRGSDVNQKNNYGETPLHLAVSRNQHEICESLIFLGAYIDQKNNNGETPLHLAVSQTLEQICASLLWLGADYEQKNKRGETPLHLAASRGSRKICENLIQRGADINQKNNRGETPLHLAQSNNHEELFTYLGDCNATIDDVNRTTVTHIAATKNQIIILEYLITKKSVDVNSQRKADKWTPLHCAAFEQHIEIFRYLMQHGANIEAKDVYGKTPLQVVRDRQFIKSVKRDVPEGGSRFIESVAKELKERSRRSVQEFSPTPDRIPNPYNQLQISSNVDQDSDRNLVIVVSDMYAPQLQNFLTIFYAIFQHLKNPVYPEAVVSTARGTLQDRMDPMAESAIKSLPEFKE